MNNAAELARKRQQRSPAPAAARLVPVVVIGVLAVGCAPTSAIPGRLAPAESGAVPVRAVTPPTGTASPYETARPTGTATPSRSASPAAAPAEIKVGNDPRDVAIAPDGKRLYVANYGSDTVSVVDPATASVVRSIPVAEKPFSVALSPDGGKAYVGGLAGVQVIDTATGAVAANATPTGPVFALAVAPDGSRVYVATYEQIAVVNPATAAVVGKIPVDTPEWLALTPDGKRLAYSTIINDGAVGVVDTATQDAVSRVPLAAPEGLAVSPDGKSFYAGSDTNSTVTVIDTATGAAAGAPIKAGTGACGGGGLEVAPDGSRVYMPCGYAYEMSAVDPEARSVVETYPIGIAGEIPGAAIAPDGEKIYLTNSRGGALMVVTV